MTVRKSKGSKGRTGSSRAAKREVTKVEHELPGGFWRQTGAVIMIVVAVVFVMTWFGEGGNALQQIHEFGLRVLGWGVYFVPLMLTFLAVKIFQAKNNRVSLVVYLAAIVMIALISGTFGILSKDMYGGEVGKLLNSYVRQIINSELGAIIYLALMFLDAIFILQMSPATALNRMKDSVRVKEEATVEKKGEEKGHIDLKINNGAGVKPMPAGKEVKKRGVFSFKKMKVRNSAESATVEKEAVEKIEKPVTTTVKKSEGKAWVMPTKDLLEKKISPQDPGNIQQNALMIKNTLAEFGIDVEMEGANVGPRVTQYTMKPPSGMNLSKISARDKELAMNLAVDKLRIEAPIPGTRSVGVEIPNIKSASVTLRSIIESSEWKNAKSALTFAVGKDISGKAMVADLADMPHLLIAGTTGSGKSVMTNALISSLIFRNSPDDLKLIIVDPKKVEMAQYEDVPHLITPIITSTEKALSAMKWVATEMDRRYQDMAEVRVKKIDEYNEKMGSLPEGAKVGVEGKEYARKMPYVVVVIDEMADLMMRASKELEPVIVRIAQLGRAAGIHLVLATQKPVVKVITGMIKGNIPARIAFRVNTSMDSRIILDVSGAEKLLGKGDMLFLTDKMMGQPTRVQGAWPYETEKGDGDVKNLTAFLKEQRPPEYNPEVVAQPVSLKGAPAGGGGDMDGLGRKYDPQDPVVRKAVEISLAKGKFSTAMLQTYLGKGHGFVSGLAIWFEEIGVIGEANGNKPREMLISSMEEFDKLAEM